MQRTMAVYLFCLAPLVNGLHATSDAAPSKLRLPDELKVSREAVSNLKAELTRHAHEAEQLKQAETAEHSLRSQVQELEQAQGHLRTQLQSEQQEELGERANATAVQHELQVEVAKEETMEAAQRSEMVRVEEALVRARAAVKGAAVKAKILSDEAAVTLQKQLAADQQLQRELRQQVAGVQRTQDVQKSTLAANAGEKKRVLSELDAARHTATQLKEQLAAQERSYAELKANVTRDAGRWFR